MTTRKWGLFFLLLLLELQSPAYEPKEGQVNAYWGPFVYRTDFSSRKVQQDERFNGGAGLLVTGDINEKGAIEIAMFQMFKTYFRQYQNRWVGERAHLLHISMGYRRWVNAWLSTSLTFYSSYSMGQKRNVLNQLLPTDVLPTSATDTTEYGFDLAVQGELWGDKKRGIVLEGRYALSMTNKTHEYGNHYGIFLAYRQIMK